MVIALLLVMNNARDINYFTNFFLQTINIVNDYWYIKKWYVGLDENQ